jgi:curved DNA-binding protein CbpA
MEQIIIDGNVYNPYFILDVVPEDTEQFVTKSFRKKAKLWHPDKIPNDKLHEKSYVDEVNHHFKVLVASYEYIINKKQSINHNNRESINIQKTSKIPTKSFDNSNELDVFNDEFEKMHIKNPNDYGYSTQPRMKDVKEYDNFNYKPEKIFNPKQFNKNDFNKLFEYQKEVYSQENNMEVGIYHKTSDGFNAYNGGELNGLANVSSYNGLMIVGDTFGQSGMGYYDANFSDYKKSFDVPKNPNNFNVPTDFEAHSNKNIKALSHSESQKQMELQLQHRQTQMFSQGSSKQNFRLMEQELLEKQERELQQKIEQDKNLILQYQDMYEDKTLIQAALNNRLVTSKDYVDEKSINKRFKMTNL